MTHRIRRATIHELALGTVEPRFHVIGPPLKGRPSIWWCFDTREKAERCAAHTRHRQIHEGTATLREHNGERYWAVERPDWVADADADG